MALEALKIKKAEKELSDEDSFRLPLKDVIEFASKLNDICDGNIEEMVKLCELGMTSSAQAKILMTIITGEGIK